MAAKINDINAYTHPDADRPNILPSELAVHEHIPDDVHTYKFDPNMSPELEWAGKTESTSFEVPVQSIHKYEKITPHRVIAPVLKDPSKTPNYQGFLFSDADPFTRIQEIGRAIEAYHYKRYLDDFPVIEMSDLWNDTGGTPDMKYVVQTSTKVIQRCILMTSDPGDLVLDITCGSGTTAYVAEQWGRRWITCDTSRIALAIARQRLLTATFPWYELADPERGPAGGFKYKTVPHITLKSIANNEPPATEILYDQPEIDSSRVRLSGPFTVEALHAPVVFSPDEAIETENINATAMLYANLPRHHSGLCLCILRFVGFVNL